MMKIIKMKKMVLFLILSTTLLLLLQQTNGDPQDIFILAGQSNMAGRGGVHGGKWDGYVPPGCKPNPSVLRLSAQLTWSAAEEPLHFDIDLHRTCGVGPGMAFGNAVKIADSSLGVVGLVPCAVGGTKITQWAKGTELYQQMISRATAAAKGGGKIRALLWYQGESDTNNQGDADAYKANMESLINNVRADLSIPSLPVIQVALASGEGNFVETVRNAQLGISLPNVKCIDAKGLALGSDHLHLTSDSQYRVGIRLAEAFISISSP